MGRMVARVTAAVLTAGCSAAPAAPDPAHRAERFPGATVSPSKAPALHQFPQPRDLGAGWSSRVAPSDPLSRDPAEVAAVAVPLGCPRASLPLARKVTEVDYAYRGRPVVALRLAFPSTREASAFVDLRHAALLGCVGLSGGLAVGPYVGHVGPSVNERTPESEPWTEIVVRREAAVVLVAAAGPLARSPLDPARWRELVGEG